VETQWNVNREILLSIWTQVCGGGDALARGDAVISAKNDRNNSKITV
jgi:hypothetical protein